MYDQNFKKLREVDRKKTAFQNNGMTYYQQGYFFYIMDNNKIVVTGYSGFNINVFDKNGKKMFDIKRDYVKRKITEEDKKKVHEFFKTNPRTRNFYETRIKNSLKFEEYFPAIRVFQPFGDKLFVTTYNEKPGRTEMVVFNNKGGYLETLWLPLIRRNIQSYMPFTICDDVLYRLIENEDEEEWELHINALNNFRKN